MEALSKRMTLPLPASVVSPVVRLEFEPSTLMVPLLVIVPDRKRRFCCPPSPAGTSRIVPEEMVTPDKIVRTGPRSPSATITPPEALVSVPDIISVACNKIPEFVPVARIVPPVFFVVPAICKVPPPVSSIVFVLVVPPLGSMNSVSDWLASITPEFTKVRLAPPMVPPPPWMVSWFVKVPPPSIIKLFSVTVPPALRVVAPRIFRNAADGEAELPRTMLPALLMFPPAVIDNDSPPAIDRLSVDPRVRLSVASAALIVTAEPDVLIHVLLLLFGTPVGVQFVLVSQLPMAPSLHVDVHCANIESGHKNIASSAIDKIWPVTLSVAA